MHSQGKHDHDIDSALKALGGVNPPDGMSIRVLHRASCARSRTPRPLFSLRGALSGAACAVAILAVWMANREHRAAYIVQSVKTAPNVTVSVSTPHEKKATLRSIPNTSPKPHVAWLTSSGYHARVDDPDARAPSRFPDDASSAPSRAAPPLPLSRQEQLLLMTANGSRSRTQIASLRRPVWPLRDPADDEDFREFFNSRTTPTTEGENE